MASRHSWKKRNGEAMHSAPFRHFPQHSATFRLFQDPASIHLIVLSLNIICDLLTSYGFNIDFDEKSLGHTQTDKHSYSFMSINMFWSIPSRLEAAGIVMVV